MDDDVTLLRQYRAGSQLAFAAIVARHVDWVHAAARRRLANDAHRADDVTQAVFVALATRGPVDRSEALMAAWMFRVLRHAAANVARAESRRRKHEAAAARREPSPATDDAWAEIAPRLDAFVDELSARDREAILLRFYRRQTNAAVGAALGIGDEGARKRIARALDKLRAKFAQAGVTMPAVALGDALTAHVAPAAPAGLTIAATPTKAAAALARAATARPIGAYALAGVTIIAAATIAVVAQAHAMPRAATSPPATLPAIDEATTRPTTMTLDELVAGIRRAETAFTNVHVIGFRSSVSRRGPNETAWTPTVRWSAGDAWFDAGPRGRMRIDYAHHSSEWIGGAAPSVGTAQRIAFDGTLSRTINVSSTHSGRTTPDPLATIDPGPSAELNGMWPWLETGAGFTLQYLASDTDGSMPPTPWKPMSGDIDKSLFAKARQAGAVIELCAQQVNGVDAIRLRCASGGVTNDNWFAPGRGFALVRSTQSVRLPQMSLSWDDSIDVYAWREAAPGAWFPMRASRVMRALGQPDGTYERHDFSAANVVANDPAFDAAIFAPTLPTGVPIYDRRVTPPRGYVVFSDGSEHEMTKGQPMPTERRRPVK